MPVIDEKQELAKKADLATKQDTLIPGTNITIAPDGKTISAADGGNTVSVSPSLSSGTPIAAITVDGNINTLFAPTPPTISITQTQLSGVNLATITVNGTPFTIYAPEGTVVLSGTSAPTSAQGNNNDLYVQYTVASGVYTVDMTYVKLGGAWIELATSGSEVEPNPQGATTATLSSIGIDGTNYAINGLPENYNITPQFLKIIMPDEYNELGWGVNDETWYYDTAATVKNNNRSYTKVNALPALGGLMQNNPPGAQPWDLWYAPIFVSTDASATTLTGWGITPVSFEYNGHTWYYGGGFNGAWSQMYDVENIEYIGDFPSFVDAAKWLIDHSGVYFSQYQDTFTYIGVPGSEYLFAGGGEEEDLSDATFKVTAAGDIIGNSFNGATTLANGSMGLVPAPLIADKDKFLKGDGTWVEAGGNVDDVNVNGVSVLDANKIAQITSYREVTQAEYDALPASKLTDNILYCINDQMTADTTVAPIIYSEEEREVGVWTDGKPLYQKTLSLTSPSSVYDVVIADLTSLSIDTLVLITGTLYSTNVNQYIPILWSYNTSTMGSIYYQFNNNELRQYITSSGYLNCQEWITIRYTKTTDQPGSGKYAPSGVPAVHYSENEQVVGTWVDGSTLYEKTLTFTISSTATTLLTDNSIKLVNAKGVASKDNAVTKNLIFPYYDTGNDYMMIQQNNGTIAFYCTNWFISNTPNITATIQYTKITS